MMNRDDIIRMAKEAGFRTDSESEVLEGDGWTIQTDLIEHFAALVAAAERARLAQPEPVAWTVGGLITDFSRDFSAYQTKTYTVPLYTAPPQREWVGLTEDDLNFWGGELGLGELGKGVLRAVEDHLKKENK